MRGKNTKFGSSSSTKMAKAHHRTGGTDLTHSKKNIKSHHKIKVPSKAGRVEVSSSKTGGYEIKSEKSTPIKARYAIKPIMKKNARPISNGHVQLREITKSRSQSSSKRMKIFLNKFVQPKTPFTIDFALPTEGLLGPDDMSESEIFEFFQED